MAKRLAPLLHPIRSKSETNSRSHTISRALCRLHGFSLCFDWFTRLSVSFVIGRSDYFGFGCTTELKVSPNIVVTRSTVKASSSFDGNFTISFFFKSERVTSLQKPPILYVWSY